MAKKLQGTMEGLIKELVIKKGLAVSKGKPGDYILRD